MMKILRPLIPAFALLIAANGAYAYYITGDLTVHSSVCIGYDCANPETYGYDTLKLKENNTRLRFDDTSVSASFPRNDWYLVANDSTNGGLSHFSLEDATAGRRVFTVEAGAQSNSLYIDDYGRIGLGTSTPYTEIHSADGDTPTLRLDQDGTSGWAAQVWDVAGNESNFFIRDVTHGSKLSFRIQPSAPTNSIYIKSNGDIGLGTASPGGALHINRAGVVLSDIQSSDNNAVQLRFRTTSTNRRIVALDGSSNVETQIVMGDSGEVQFLGATSGDLNATINSTGLNVNGTISLNGSQIHPDYVFEPTYKLATIEDQAAYMFGEKHLPAVGAGTYDEHGRSVLDIGKKTMGILEELEKAHLYIVQLNDRLKKIEQSNAKLEQSNAELREQVAKMRINNTSDTKL
jgi:hypothetical protein